MRHSTPSLNHLHVVTPRNNWFNSWGMSGKLILCTPIVLKQLTGNAIKITLCIGTGAKARYQCVPNRSAQKCRVSECHFSGSTASRGIRSYDLDSPWTSDHLYTHQINLSYVIFTAQHQIFNRETRFAPRPGIGNHVLNMDSRWRRRTQPAMHMT